MTIENHRTRYFLVLHLVFLFIVFSVGLPIIVASCPMAQGSQRPVCSQCLPNADRQSTSVTKYVDRSCCATVFAASRNTTEFTRSGNDQFRAFAAVELPLPATMSVADQSQAGAQILADDPVLPLREDIPLLVSSLLI